MQSSKMSLKSFFSVWHFLLGYYVSFNLAKTLCRLGNWFLRNTVLSDWKKQKDYLLYLAVTFELIFANFDSFCLIASHMHVVLNIILQSHPSPLHPHTQVKIARCRYHCRLEIIVSNGNTRGIPHTKKGIFFPTHFTVCTPFKKKRITISLFLKLKQIWQFSI